MEKQKEAVEKQKEAVEQQKEAVEKQKEAVEQQKESGCRATGAEEPESSGPVVTLGNRAAPSWIFEQPPHLQHHRQRHQSLVEWQRERKERQ